MKRSWKIYTCDIELSPVSDFFLMLNHAKVARKKTSKKPIREQVIKRCFLYLTKIPVSQKCTRSCFSFIFNYVLMRYLPKLGDST